MAQEIERKYLIHMPDLTGLPCERWDIEQIYLTSATGETRRIRKIVCAGSASYYFTHKQRVSAMTCIEDERAISQQEYNRLSAEADPGKRMIVKTRFRLPHEGHIVEIDIFPFWHDRALCEIELRDENEVCPLPDFVKLIREVTNDFRYKNTMLAVDPPMEALP